jgi:hypothetical protein
VRDARPVGAGRYAVDQGVRVKAFGRLQHTQFDHELVEAPESRA